MTYRAPVATISTTLKHVAGMALMMDDGKLGDLSGDLVDAILTEAGRFAGEELAPLNTVGDEHGATLDNGNVTTAPGWKEVYDNWAAGGWNALVGPEEFGGQGLPVMLLAATFEMWNSAACAFGIGPTLTIGAVEAIEAHGSDALKQTYLEKMVSGEWMGTMNLTEPQAGSDLNALRARAKPMGDGTYKIFGQKIFITYGDHDLTENIIHLVLARLPDAPPGTRGISLFVVPKVLVNEDGSLGDRNDVVCGGLEHKLGIHGSPTCTMLFGDNGGAVGYLLGEENKGLRCMFTMMNNARLAIGVQGLAVAERAYQQAVAYAAERRQGRAPGWSGEGMSPIVEHPDIRRTLLSMKSLTQAARSIAYACAHAIDMARASDGDDKLFWQERANLLTPLAKAFSTDVGVDVASMGVQVHGGMGYIEETGAAQHLRDARITPIYEGTNGIQAIDLVTRKLPQSGGNCIATYIGELRRISEDACASNQPEMGVVGDRLAEAIDDMQSATDWMLKAVASGKMPEALSGATPYLRLVSLAAGGAYLTKLAIHHGRAGDDPAATKLSETVARFFAEHHLSETTGLLRTVTAGAEPVLSVDLDALEA